MLGKAVVLVTVAVVVVSCAHSSTGQSAATVAETLARRAAPTAPTVTPADANTYARLCPALDAYNKVDGAGQAALGAGIVALAQEAKKSDDPGVRAFAGTVPSLVQGQGKARTAARQFLLRECDAHLR